MLELKKYLKPGEKIQINYIDASGRLREYVSQIVDIHDNEYVDILIPIHQQHDVYLKEDTLLKMVIPKGEAIYEFKAVIHQKLFGRIPLLRLIMLSDVNKIQRRDFYRLRLMMDIEARLVEDFKERKYGESFKCSLLDISAGGLLFGSRKELNEKDLIEFTLSLNGKKLIMFGVIVRRNYTDDSKISYNYGVKFERVSEFERNEITRFIFEEQRKLIKKGLV